MSIVLRAQITIDVSADDFVGAAEHQRRLEDLMTTVRGLYHEADLSFRERRPRPARTLPGRQQIRHYTGAAADYKDD